MNHLGDQQLLREYADSRSEAAFAELVRRHIDFVYSAALRMVCDSHQAEDVTQGVFVALAQNARQLTHHPVLSGWLHRTALNIAANAVRSDVRRRAHEQEAAAMNELLSAESETVWELIAPRLDDALNELDEADRDALFLRYFQHKSLREVGATLGTSDDAAQKRVSRAVERLREFFAKRGVTVGASGLVVVISANAVQAAPVGLAVTISTAATLAGTGIATAATTTAIKTITMTALQKTIVTVTVVVLAGAGSYEARQASQLRNQNQALQQQQQPMAGQIQQLQRERDDATNRLMALNDEFARSKSEQKQAELLRLRGQVGTLRQQLASTEAQSNSTSGGFAKMMSDPAMKDYIHVAMQDLIKRRYGPLFQELKLTPEQVDRFLQLTSDFSTKGAQRLAAPQQAGGGAVASVRTEAEQNAEFGKQLAGVLGESGMARFQEFGLEVPARATVDQLNVQLGGSKLSDEQSARLFQAVRAEPFELTHGIAGDPDPAFFGSQADIDNHLRKVAESNQRVLQQAGDFLNPEQLAALNTVLSNGINARIAQGAALSPKH